MDATPNTDVGGGPIVVGSPFRATLALVAGPRRDAATGYAGTEALSAAAVAGPGMPAEWTPHAAWADPFDPDAPEVVLSWEGSETVGVEPGTYEVYLSVDGATAPVGHATMIGGVGAGVLVPAPLIGIEELKATVGSWPEALQSSATLAGLRRTLSLATEDLYSALADRRMAGRGVDCGGSAYESERARYYAALVGDPAADPPVPSRFSPGVSARRYVAWQALWYLTAATPTAREGESSLRPVAATARELADSCLGTLSGTVEGFGGVARRCGPGRVHRG